MEANIIGDAVRLSFERGVQWLCRRRSEGGGWGDDQGSPTVGITGHVLLAFAELGMSSSHPFRDDLAFIGRLSRRDKGRYGTYWSEDILRAYSDPKSTMGGTLQAALPIAQYESGFQFSGINCNKLKESVLKWGMEMTETSQQIHASCGMWEHYQLAKVLDALLYKGNLWNRLKESIRHKRNPDGASWPSLSEGVNKETAQALQALLRCPDIDTNEIRTVVDYLFSRVIQSQDYAYWESDVDDPVRGVFFNTRWVILALLEASNILSFDGTQLETLKKAVYWLVSIQRHDGGWVETVGDPLGRDEERDNRPAGPGFVAYAVLSLGKWLLFNGASIQDIRGIVESNFSATGKVWKGKCFVLMPFAKEYDPVFDQAIKPTVQSDEIRLQCVRVDQLEYQGNVIADIVREICDADVIVADLSGRNPNVFYELGISHALTNKTVMITRDESLPFDLRTYRVIFYEDSIAGAEQLKSKLAQTILTILKDEHSKSNPVQDFLRTDITIRRAGQALKRLQSSQSMTYLGINDIYIQRGEYVEIRPELMQKALNVALHSIYAGLASGLDALIEQELQREINIQILIADPASRYIQSPPLQLAVMGSDTSDKIQHDLDVLKNIDLRRQNNSWKGILQVRLYDQQPMWCIYMFDDELFAAPYLYRVEGGETFCIHAKHKGLRHSTYNQLRRHYRLLWDSATVVIPTG